jgi:hypothetical protein
MWLYWANNPTGTAIWDGRFGTPPPGTIHFDHVIVDRSSVLAPLVLGIGDGAGVVAHIADTGLVHETRRLALIGVVQNASPPSFELSFYSPIADGAYTVTEAGLLYEAADLTVGGAGKYMTHLAFAYSKPATEDVRYAYSLPRA